MNVSKDTVKDSISVEKHYFQHQCLLTAHEWP